MVSTATASPKVAALSARPDMSLAIDAGGTPEQAQSLTVRGRATVEIVDGVVEEYLAATRKSMDEEGAAEFERHIRGMYPQIARIGTTPRGVRYDFGAGRMPRFLPGAGGAELHLTVGRRYGVRVAVLSILGVPSSAGSYAAGQDQAPRALRGAGLVDHLVAAGVEVVDAGDLTEQVWAPDREDRFAQNTDQVATSVRELADRVPDLLADDRRLLVLGGNCTIAVGLAAGLTSAVGRGCGLLYVDRHFDMNTPDSTIDGALDWMGLAHALDLPGCRDRLAGAFETRPVLHPDQLVMLGIDPTQATDFERDQAAALGVRVTTQSELTAAPARAAATALAALPDAPFAVHVDVDVLDFVDAPLAENTSSRNVGPTLDQLAAALDGVVADPRWRALSIGELNPTRCAGDPEALTRFVSTLARCLS